VIEKGLHRLSWVDIDPASPTCTAVTPITDALNDPQMAVALNAAGDTVYVAEADAGRLAAVDVDTGHVSTVTADLERPTDVALDEPNNAAIVLENPPPSPTYDFASHISRVDLTIGVVDSLRQAPRTAGGP
jgi:DNA-binding beta-propeller fold protein YncE